MPYTVSHRLWLTADGTRLVGDDDAHGYALFAVCGEILSDEAAMRYGLMPDLDNKIETQIETQAPRRRSR